MARSTPILILSLLLLAVVSNACNTCMLPSPPPPPPKPTPCPPPPPAACPRDTLKLGKCMDLLGGVVGGVITPPSSPCCALLEDLASMEVAICLCTVIKANMHGIHLKNLIALSVIVNACGKSIPPGFKCE